MSRSIIIAGFFAGVGVASLLAQPAPPKRGGYGDAVNTPRPASPAALPGAAQPAPPGSAGALKTTLTPDTRAPAWRLAAEARVGAAVDELNQHVAAMDQKWNDTAARMDARVRELMVQAGFSADEMAQSYTPPHEPTRYSYFYGGFYGTATNILTKIRLRLILNPPISNQTPEPTWPDGNRDAIEATVRRLDETMGTFRYFEGLLQKELAARFEEEAQERFFFANERRTQLQIDAVRKMFDDGAYEDAANTAARAKMQPLDQKEQVLRAHHDNAWDPRQDLQRLELISHLAIFAPLERQLALREDPMATRTDSLLSVVQAAQHVEPYLLDLGKRSNDLFNFPAIHDWNVDPTAYLAFYQRQTQAIETSLQRWCVRGGAKQEDLDRLDAQMKSMAEVELDLHARLQQLQSYERQRQALRYRSDDLDGQIYDLERQARQLDADGQHDSASALRNQEDPIRDQITELNKTSDQLNLQEGNYATESRDAVNKMEFLEAVPSGRVIGVWFLLPTEAQPRKWANIQYPLKGAQVDKGIERHFADIPVGLPVTVSVGWEEEDSGEADAPDTLSLTLNVGGKAVPLTLYHDPYNYGYKSDRLVFRPAAPGAATPTTMTRDNSPPATVDRSASPSPLAGTWDVGYEDLALGEINGTAIIDSNAQHVTLTLRDPTTKQTYQLKSESVTAKGDDYTIVLVGDNPAASSLMPDATVQQQANRAAAESMREVLRPGLATLAAKTGKPVVEPKILEMAPLPTMPNFQIQPMPLEGPPPKHPVHQQQTVTIELPDGADKLQVSVAEFQGEIALKPWHAVETNRVTLNLHHFKGHTAANYTTESIEKLSGSWKFNADPVTWRDTAGRGRVGNLRRERENPSFVTQSALETWQRGTPESTLQLFAVGVFHWLHIDRFYLGVPTVVEAIFDEPQEKDTCTIDVMLGGRKLSLPAHRDPENWRRFTTDPFLPGDDPRPAPPATTKPVPKPSDDDEDQHPL